MNRLMLIVVVALLGMAAFVVGDLLDPETVPVAEAVQLTGPAPADGPPREGFFVVPPPVVDLRELVDDADDVDDDLDDDDDSVDDDDDSVDDDD